MKLPSINKVRNLQDKRVLVRLALNVPINGRDIQDDFRLKKVLPTLKMLSKKGARTIVVSHLSKGESYLRPVVRWLNKHLPVGYLPDIDRNRTAVVVDKMKKGSIIVLENLRHYPGEKKNDPKFAEQLASFADIYVNEDFPVSHRKHASVVEVPKFLPSYVGPVFENEVKELSKAFKPKKPFIVISGGAKFEAKLPLVKKFLPKADKVFIVGALANSFFKEMGYEVGKSLVDKKKLGLKALAKKRKLVLPKDVIAVGPKGDTIKRPDEVKRNEKILGVGPETVAEILEAISDAKMILWNGPLGKFEGGYRKNTEKVAKAIARADAHTIVGGGETLSAIQDLGLLKKYDFVSTGGGAMLDFLADGTLPGIEAIQKSKKRLKTK